MVAEECLCGHRCLNWYGLCKAEACFLLFCVVSLASCMTSLVRTSTPVWLGAVLRHCCYTFVSQFVLKLFRRFSCVCAWAKNLEVLLRRLRAHISELRSGTLFLPHSFSSDFCHVNVGKDCDFMTGGGTRNSPHQSRTRTISCGVLRKPRFSSCCRSISTTP